ncbi:MAG TPA: zinc ribbon domain-containing protein [Firmicutes bacterium]|nr:zinc ribbon domain-containing protein [Bacillota bacterium]
MYCTNCGAEISDKAEYCPRCGFHPKKQRNFCNQCGAALKPNQELCIQCGKLIRTAPSVTRLAPWAAALISFFIPGLGQILVGQVVKGCVILILTLTAFLFGPIINILAALDAYLITKKINRGTAVGPWEFF